jgi:uncharacterized membrane protein
VAITNFIGGVVLLALALPFEPGALAAANLQWGAVAWLTWWYLLVPASLGATIIYFRLMRDWGAGRVGTYAFISPIVAVLLGILVAGERVANQDGVRFVRVQCTISFISAFDRRKLCAAVELHWPKQLCFFIQTETRILMHDDRHISGCARNNPNS